MVEIRPYRGADGPAVVALWKRCGLVVAWNDPQADIVRKLRVAPELFLVAVEDGRLIGTAMGGYDGHRGSLNYLAVDHNRRRRGIGSCLIEAVCERLLERDCAKLNIMVRTDNRDVIAFYEKLGFKTDDVVCMGHRLLSDET